MNTLILTVGLPRSGKSTWARQQGCPIVNPDALRLALHGERFIAQAEPIVWTMAHYMVHALFLAGHETVILDATNTTRKRRDEWLSKEWGVKYAVTHTSMAECLRRTSGVDDPLLPVIKRMAAEYEVLEPAERAASFAI